MELLDGICRHFNTQRTRDMIRCICIRSLALAFVLLACAASGQETEKQIPEILGPWKEWVLWDQAALQSPSPFNSAGTRIAVWPSALEFVAGPTGASWRLQVRAFDRSWLPLPGESRIWPEDVRVNETVVPVIEREGVPAVELEPGLHQITGSLKWLELPEKILIPRAIGILNLQVNDQEIPFPAREADGALWLKRTQSTEVEKDQLTMQIHRVIEDGLPIWLRTELEVSVSGKSREEELGFVLPSGWQLSSVGSPIPIALDESGKAKVQVHAGTWRIRIDAFRNEDLTQLAYAPETPPTSPRELVALRSRPLLRAVELQGAVPVDVNMTTFPKDWRDLTVFEWDTANPLQWVIKSSGAGEQRPRQLSFVREIWLDDDGAAMTWQDNIWGSSRQITRLDVSADNELAAVRVNGERQLVTLNPATGAQGVELRSMSPKIDAIGRAKLASEFPASGWQTDADFLRLTFNLPPGWRILALFGADKVEGDWLTAWSLLDLFLLLVFSLAIFRLWGFRAGLIAFLGFGLAYHEWGAPRYTWLFLLVPVALLTVVRHGRLAKILTAWKWTATVLLLLFLLPFVAREIQSALYPQLEPGGVSYRRYSAVDGFLPTSRYAAELAPSSQMAAGEDHDGQFQTIGGYPAEIAQTEDFNFRGGRDKLDKAGGGGGVIGGAEFDREGQANDPLFQSDGQRLQNQERTEPTGSKAIFQKGMNLKFDPGTRIQTGVAKPDWTGNIVNCFWSGPVKQDQSIRAIFLPANWHRLLIVVRLILLGLLFALLLQPGKATTSRTTAGDSPGTVPVLTSILFFLIAISATQPVSAQVIPREDILNQLRDRLLRPSEAFPHAANFPNLNLTIREGQLSIKGQVHAAADCAVPVPGIFPSWSPLAVRVGDSNGIICRRNDGYLWVFVPKGIHDLQVDGLVGESSEWVWSFALPPRKLEIDAADWNVAGLRKDGSPENQLFFTRKVRAGDAASYDQKNFRAVVQVDRAIELGLEWKVRTTVRRLSATGRAIALQVPAIAGERVVTGSVEVLEGLVTVNLAADENEFAWESVLAVQPELTLLSQQHPQSVERWSTELSPVWNVTFADLQPVFESDSGDLVPVWYPWPGQQVRMSIKRPDAAPGKTLTVQRAWHHLALGARQQNSELGLDLESSLGGEFAIELPASAVVREVKLQGASLPVRKEGDRYLIGLQPGPQKVELKWSIDEKLEMRAGFPPVKIPADAANITSSLSVPESRWILWTSGPERGPAVRFWAVLAFACCLAIGLGLIPGSPLKMREWLLLAIGLTQLHFIGGLFIVCWLFLLRHRGRRRPEDLHWFYFNLFQLFLILLTAVAMILFVVVVSRGLLGSPEMFIAGQGSWYNQLNWFAPAAGADLPQPGVITVSIWFYRLLMLFWALWLANSLIRWLKAGWTSFSSGGVWRSRPKVVAAE
jgi:hypothetical protein